MAPFTIDVEAPRPTAHAASLGADAIHVDGAGDEPAWSRAPVVSWDTDYAGNKTAKTTRARFLWSPSALYELVEMDGVDPRADPAPTDVERARLYDEDCVETFLAPQGTYARHYDEIDLGPRGHFLDVRVDRLTGAGDAHWSSGVVVKTRLDPAAHRAVIEARIPMAIAPGAVMRLGLYRVDADGPARAYLAWSPPRTAKPDFHVFDAFGKLVVDR